MKAQISNKNNALNNILEPQEKKLIIKEFLLQHSVLVKFNNKQLAGGELNQREQAQENRIYELRDRIFRRIIEQVARYYETVSEGDYRFAGMPTIERGIRGWIESKIWRLLVSIGEPEHWRLKEKNYWEEAI